MLDFLFLLLFLYLAFIAVVGSIALYGKVIDRDFRGEPGARRKDSRFRDESAEIRVCRCCLLGHCHGGGFWPSYLSRRSGGVAALENVSNLGAKWL